MKVIEVRVRPEKVSEIEDHKLVGQEVDEKYCHNEFDESGILRFRKDIPSYFINNEGFVKERLIEMGYSPIDIETDMMLIELDVVFTNIDVYQLNMPKPEFMI